MIHHKKASAQKHSGIGMRSLQNSPVNQSLLLLSLPTSTGRFYSEGSLTRMRSAALNPSPWGCVEHSC